MLSSEKQLLCEEAKAAFKRSPWGKQSGYWTGEACHMTHWKPMPQPDFNKLPALPFTLLAHLSLHGALSCSAPISICWRASSEVYGRTILGRSIHWGWGDNMGILDNRCTGNWSHSKALEWVAPWSKFYRVKVLWPSSTVGSLAGLCRSVEPLQTQWQGERWGDFHRAVHTKHLNNQDNLKSQPQVIMTNLFNGMTSLWCENSYFKVLILLLVCVGVPFLRKLVL